MNFKLTVTFLILFISFLSYSMTEVDTTLHQSKYSEKTKIADSLLERLGYMNGLKGKQRVTTDPIPLNPSRVYFATPHDSSQSINPKLSAIITIVFGVVSVILFFVVRRALINDKKRGK